MREDAPLDVIVYGASGYTGRLVAEHLQQNYGADTGTKVKGEKLKWALAGRSRERLEAVRRDLGIAESVPLLTADCEDKDALHKMIMQGKAVISTVGPYQLYGKTLVGLCAETGTDYLDLCGEPNFMADMIKAHHETAQKNAARIVFSCGFDSAPFDLGVQFLAYEGHKRIGHRGAQGPFDSIATRVLAMEGSFSGGTAASMTATMEALKREPALGALLANPFALTAKGEGAEQPDMGKAREDAAIGSWVAPFIMAPINTKNIHRANEVMGYPYGEKLIYDEMLCTGAGEQGKARAESPAAQNPFGDAMPKPGEGPSKEERERGFYKILILGYRKDNIFLSALVTGDKDPGYGSTSKILAESALCLVESCWGLDGGCHTPASSMGLTLRYRLTQKAGLTFDFLGDGPGPARETAHKILSPQT